MFPNGKGARCMHSLRQAVPLALVAGLVAASPAAADQHAGHHPVARSSGSDAGPPVYPGLVNTRLVRTQKALDRAVDYADDGETDKAVSALYTARLQVKLAWRAGKYVIEHAPPAAPGPDLRQLRIPVRVHARRARRTRARTSAVADQF